MALPGPVRDFLHDRSLEIGIFAAVATGFLEATLAVAAVEAFEGAREFLRLAPFWVWAVPPAAMGFVVWLKLHDLAPSEEAQSFMDKKRREGTQFAIAERIRRANKR